MLPTCPGSFRVPRLHDLADRREKIVAGLLAAATHLGTDAAVFVVGGVAIALLGTGEARHRTCFDHCADKAEIRGGLACHDAAGGRAGVGAVEAEVNAVRHLAHVVLGKVGIGTTGTAGEAVEARVKTADEGVPILDGGPWMQRDDLLKGHVSLLRSRDVDRVWAALRLVENRC
jgi:hypothetical protein